MFIQIDKGMYERLSETEKGVIQSLNQSEKGIPYISITNIAEETFISQSTVFKAIQKCGYQGISQLRYAVSQRGQMKEHHESSYEVNNILAGSYRESIKMTDNISSVAMLKTIKYIKQARRILIFTRGFTALTAEGFQIYLQLLGYNVIIVRDVRWMESIERIVTKDDIAFILSLRNSTPGLARSARVARMRDARVITCCCKSPCELEKFSDITIYDYFEQIMKVSGMTVYSRISPLIITGTITEYIGQQSS